MRAASYNRSYSAERDDTEMRYRPDIDGMRAFAVIVVVIYHAFPRLFPGGFIGVDVFL